MSDDAPVLVMEITVIEAAHLRGLAAQFVELLEDTDAASATDPAVRRLVPDAYPGDDAASEEFRRLTGDDLLRRRAAEARAMMATLDRTGALPEAPDIDDAVGLAVRTVSLTADEAASWVRTLAAVRLVMASRLGIDREDDHSPDDPRFLLYDWIGGRLDGMVAALDRG